jgi:hypothetical protein
VTTYEVVFKFTGKRRFLIEASCEDEAAERAEQELRNQCVEDADVDLLGVRESKGRQ